MSFYDFNNDFFTGTSLPGVEDRSHIIRGLENKSSNMENAAEIEAETEAAVSWYLSWEFVDEPIDRKEIFGKGFKIIMEDLRCKNGKFQVLLYVYRSNNKFPLFLAEKDDTGKLIIRSLTKDYYSLLNTHTSPMYGFANDPSIIEIRRRPNTTTYDIYKKKDYHPSGNYVLQPHSFVFMKRNGSDKYSTRVFSMMNDDSDYLKMPMIKLPNKSPGYTNSCYTFDKYVIKDTGTSDSCLSVAFAIALAKLDSSSDEFHEKRKEEMNNETNDCNV